MKKKRYKMKQERAEGLKQSRKAGNGKVKNLTRKKT